MFLHVIYSSLELFERVTEVAEHVTLLWNLVRPSIWVLYGARKGDLQWLVPE